MRKEQSGFSFIELLMVTAIIAILAMIAVPMFKQYKERVHNAATQSMLQHLALSQGGYSTDHNGNYLIPIDSTDISRELLLLSTYGFRPDPNIAFTIFPSPTDAPSFRVFAVNKQPGSQLFLYDQHMGLGAFPVNATVGGAPLKLNLYYYSLDSSNKIVITKGPEIKIDPDTFKSTQ